jgi:CheY-like chemotaxis protein
MAQPTILIVDGDQAVIRTLVLLVNEAGCLPLTATTAEDGWRLFADDVASPDPSICAAIIDAEVSSREGIRLAGRLKQGPDPHPAVLLYGNHQMTPEYPADRFISKPFKVEEITAFLADYCSGAPVGD